ncbi:creatinine amidohydrolase [Mycobacterium intracellulare]|uniref:creatininase family protein n=1 Tax=Mycobacterium intracellulare TaxID=1767 RepID=UPI00193876DA|nr:creatinine amidohydrolase [Mycobacterium intracellulare]
MTQPRRPAESRPLQTVLPATTTTDPEAGWPVAVLPIGSCEQHGPYLPLTTDTLIASALAAAISEFHQLRQLPPITISCSHEHAAFTGTLSVTATTLAAIITDIAESLTQQGAAGLIIVNAHGGNAVLTNIVQQANTGGPLSMGLYPSREDWTEARAATGITSTSHDDMHAGELETSILLAAYPDYLRPGWHTSDHTHADRRYLTTLGIRAFTDTGVIGQPSLATADKGRALLDHLAKAAHPLIALLTSGRHRP